MHHELNTPAEIRRRLFFVLYLCNCISSLVIGVIGLFRTQLSLTLPDRLEGGCSFLLKQYGEQEVEFKRLARSFPFGAPEDELPESLRRQRETLFRKFHSQKHDWQRRHEIRRKPAEMVDQNPDILKAYPVEIKAIIPKRKNRCPG